MKYYYYQAHKVILLMGVLVPRFLAGAYVMDPSYAIRSLGQVAFCWVVVENSRTRHSACYTEIVVLE